MRMLLILLAWLTAFAPHDFHRVKDREQRPGVRGSFADAMPFAVHLKHPVWPQVPLVLLILGLLLERRQRQRAQRLNRAVLGALPGAVALLDSGGVVLRTHPLPAHGDGPGGLPVRQLLSPGRPFLEVFQEAARAGPPEMDGAVALLRDVLTKRVREGVTEWQGPAAGTWFEMRAHRLELPEGGTFVSMVDVSARRRAELEARQARDERAHLQRVATVGELGVSIAHELNQPLAAILNNARTAQRLLARPPVDLRLLAEILQDIVSDDQRAGEIIRHMRALLRREEARHLHHDLNALVRGVMRLVEPDARLRGADLVLCLAESILHVHGDGVQLQQVVLNLTLNALDAVVPRPVGGRQVWVTTRRVGAAVELVLEDSGVGMSEEALRHLFEPFFTTKSHGMGMGLAISRSILEVHQGRLQAESREGGGCRLRCTLPWVDGPSGDGAP
ncbi:sensor histidine kinase [Corallococcus carmarthensis]|nr:ATP-binding protein [Corallococcus carmarthensis]